MGPAELLRESLAPAIDLVYPPRCPLCGEGIGAQAGLCVTCWGRLVIPGSPACASCQLPFSSDLPATALCAPCLTQQPRHDGIAAATLYNDTSRQLVLAIKHGGRVALAPMLARLIRARLPERVGPDWLVVPVPLHRWRLWRRGYNQAALLATELARLIPAPLAVDALARRKATPTLGGLGRKARERALAGAIVLGSERGASLKGRQVVLVDDVLTSGATTNACVAQLKRAGVAEVVIACFARVVDGPATSAAGTDTNETPGI
jgi:ComF family protein